MYRKSQWITYNSKISHKKFQEFTLNKHYLPFSWNTNRAAASNIQMLEVMLVTSRESSPRQIPGSVEGSFAGCVKGSFACSFERSFAGSFEASFVGSFEGSFACSIEGSFSCSFEGSFAGSFKGSFTGSFEGFDPHQVQGFVPRPTYIPAPEGSN